MCCLRYLCLLGYSSVQHILCYALYFVCLRSVLCAKYCQLPWIVQSSFCVMCQVLSASLDCPVFVLCYVPSIISFPGLSSLRSVLCAKYCQLPWIVQSSFCVMCQVLSASLDCPYLIALSLFSNVYSV